MSVASGKTSIGLKEKGNLSRLDECNAVGWQPIPWPRSEFGFAEPFLRIPPFPGASDQHFVRSEGVGTDGADLLAAVRRLRVGGSYWAQQPKLPSRYVLSRSQAAAEAAGDLIERGASVCWTKGPVHELAGTTQAVTGDCDPWHMVASASAVVIECNDELRVIAAVLGIPAYLYDPTSDKIELDAVDVAELLAVAIGTSSYLSPFTGEPISPLEAVELCGFWRRLIDSNRDVAGGLGFAFWKQSHVAPLLWSGGDPFRFLRNASEASQDGATAIWRAKISSQILEELDHSGRPTIEVEDGFLRSRGLGADCIPPLSITVDRLGAHFDPQKPSQLENLLQQGDFDSELLARAAQLRELIVAAGLGKYEQGGAALDRPAGQRNHILVPGQVEDDRAVVLGGCGLTSNLDLLRRVRDEAPDACILYKPHPDVLAGHRRGAISDRACLEYADRLVGDLPIGSLIAMVDEVHVNTSLAGFEALLRGKKVTTYGVPFYSGWGLTRDLGPVPARRTARRTLDELVAATLLMYPRYLDPVTGLPCPAEVAVARLCAAEAHDPGLLVGVRRLQGKIMRRLRSLVQ